jgi:hypothetical protein
MNSTIFVLFGKYCPIVDQLGSKDLSRDFQLNYIISYFLPKFTTSCEFKDWCDEESEKIETFGASKQGRGPLSLVIGHQHSLFQMPSSPWPPAAGAPPPQRATQGTVSTVAPERGPVEVPLPSLSVSRSRALVSTQLALRLSSPDLIT